MCIFFTWLRDRINWSLFFRDRVDRGHFFRDWVHGGLFLRDRVYLLLLLLLLLLFAFNLLLLWLGLVELSVLDPDFVPPKENRQCDGGIRQCELQTSSPRSDKAFLKEAISKFYKL